MACAPNFGCVWGCFRPVRKHLFAIRSACKSQVRIDGLRSQLWLRVLGAFRPLFCCPAAFLLFSAFPDAFLLLSCCFPAAFLLLSAAFLLLFYCFSHFLLFFLCFLLLFCFFPAAFLQLLLRLLITFASKTAITSTNKTSAHQCLTACSHRPTPVREDAPLVNI